MSILKQKIVELAELKNQHHENHEEKIKKAAPPPTKHVQDVLINPINPPDDNEPFNEEDIPMETLEEGKGAIINTQGLL